jgi:type VI secretion system protein ImpJ
MRQLQHVIWSKGVFLTPQHLQSQDRYLEDLLQFQLQSCSSHLWGLSRLQIDRKRLVDGQFCLLEASGILPDGMLFDIPDADAAPPPRAIHELLSAEVRQVNVFLSVPEQQTNGMNTGTQQDTKTRFVVDSRVVRDDNSGSSDKQVQIARKNLKLSFEGENQEGSTLLPLARVVSSTTGILDLDPNFVPPLIDVHGNDSLRESLRALVEILASRSAALGASRRQKNQSLADFTASDIANFWLLYTINQHLPLFSHLSDRRPTHPELLFSEMLSLAGALTTFSTSVAIRDLPHYDHSQLGECFQELERKIRFLLDTVVPTNFVAIPLKPVGPSIYAAAIEDETYLHDCRFYLAVSASLDDGDLIRRVPLLMKVGAGAHVEQMIRQALPGLKMAHVANPPPELPVKLRYRYFSVELTGSIWDGIRRGRNVAVYVPLEIPDPQLELLILLPHRRAQHS